MPRQKSVPIAKRPLIDDNNCDETQQQIQVQKKVKSNKKHNKKVYQFIIDKEFEQFLSNANFYLTINYFSRESIESIPDSSECLLGSFSVEFITEEVISFANIDVINKQLLYLYCKQTPFESIVFYECNESQTGKHISVKIKSNNNNIIDFDIINAFNSSQFLLTTNLLINKNEIIVDVWLQKSSIKKLSFHSQIFKGINYNVLTLMNYFYDFPLQIDVLNNEVTKENVEDLYSKIKAKHEENKSNIPNIDVQHPSLYPKLRQYQIKAVQWMLNRERKDQISPHQLLYQKIKTIDGREVYYNRYLGYFCDEQSFPLKYVYGISPSGIIADEMGLGKTIEVLSCILSNPKTPDDDLIDEYYDMETEFDEYFEGCFECVCGEFCDIESYKRNLRKSNCILENNRNNKDIECESDIDSDNTVIEDQSDTQLEDNLQNESIIAKTNQIEDENSISDNIKANKSRKESKRKKTKSKIKLLVQCRSCGSYQHAICVNFDIDKCMPYYCGHCWVREGMKPVNSRATLIVSPRSISHQWQEEITKHVDCSNLNIFVYEGVKGNKGYIQPFDLADNDIVLTTYETLRSEIDFINLQHSNRFRNPKRFNATPSPLIAINWWRICLDEAQMVESASAKTAQMANKLYGKHRWCITGTPIQRSINDIYGLLMFIGEEPYHERLYWEVMLYWPYSCGNSEPLVTALSHCFWRTCKSDVWQQLGIPLQSTTVKTLKFSLVEQHFYLRQHNECQRKFNEKMIKFSDLNIRLKELDKKTANILLKPMLSLRQACCHPQAVRGKFLPISKKTLTMDELLKTMIKNTQYECEEEHRKLISAINGIAAIHIIQEDYSTAIEFYRKALNSIENYKAKDLFRTDKLQQFHTLHNLAEIFELCGIKQKHKNTNEFYHKEANDNPKTTSIVISVDFGRTLRDDYVKYESKQLYDEYLAKGTASVAEVFEQLKPFIANTNELENLFQLSNQNPWWKLAINYLRTNDEEYNLITRVKEALEQHNLRGTLGEESLSKFVSISTKFRESSGLIYIIEKCLRELSQSRQILKEKVIKLNPKPTEEELNQAIDCHLRPERDKEGNRANHVVKCKYCLIHELFNEYEMKLYYFSAEEKTEEAACKSHALMEKLRRGNWGDSETEQSLKVINQLFKNKANISQSIQYKHIVDDGLNHIKLFESLKREFRGLRAIWIQIFDFISQIDELNMATIRLRLRYDNEPKPKEAVTYILERNEVDNHLITLKSDEIMAKNLMAKKLSHLYYLNNLSKDESTRKGGQNPEMCPICQFSMGEQWSVLQCGHSLCVKCLDIMINQYSRNTGSGISIQCALCREPCPLSAILYVDSSVTEEDRDPIEVIGSWSTKVEEVVRCLLKITREDPSAKSLLFSTWNDVLQLISNALLENKINHCFIKHSVKFAENIDTFKHNSDIKVLLLPIHSGSKGLNLIEATHVILVEPTLNKANELQAVGRVHRIGQTKPTFVHRFLVKSTIEERISDLYSSDEHKNNSLSPQLAETSEHAFITLNQMKQLFDSA